MAALTIIEASRSGDRGYANGEIAIQKIINAIRIMLLVELEYLNVTSDHGYAEGVAIMFFK